MMETLTWKELISQPAHWRDLIDDLTSGKRACPVEIKDYEKIIIFGSGTSYYLGLALADWMQRRGLNARAVPSCEIILDPFETQAVNGNALAIGLSRSGRSSELLIAEKKLRDAGFNTLAVSCTDGSASLKQAEHAYYIPQGYEDGLIMLRSFTCMLIALQWATGSDADKKGMAKLPDAGEAILANSSVIEKAIASRQFNRFVFLASGSDYPLAREAALKIQEMAIATSEVYHSLDYRHGPKACADENTFVVLYALSDQDHGQSLVRDIRAIGAHVMVIGQDADSYMSDLNFQTPQFDIQGTDAAALIMPAQILGHLVAQSRGQNPDAPVNLSKVVEF